MVPPPLLQLLRSSLDRLANAYIGATAAKIPAHRLFDVHVCRLGSTLKQSNSTHDLPALTVPALHDIMRDPGVLHGTANRVLRHGFNREDRTATDERNGDHTGTGCQPAEMHGTGAAGGDATSILGTCHLQLFSQHPKQRSTGVHSHVLRLAVHGELVSFHDEPPGSGILWAGRSRFDPFACGRDEFLVRKRRQRLHPAVTLAAGLECPEYQRLLCVMLQ